MLPCDNSVQGLDIPITMGSSEAQVQHQLPETQQHSHDQFQQLYCQQQKSEHQQQLQRESNSSQLGERENSSKRQRLPSEAPEEEEVEPKQAYSLSWKEFPSNFISFFKELQEAEELVDVTLACEGRQISAHKVVLAASSPFFRRLLKTNPCQHPIIILNEVRYSELTPLLRYMYHGEVNVQYDQITNFLRTARLLQVRGLTGDSSADGVPSNKDYEEKTEAAESGEPKKEEYETSSTPEQVEERPRSRSPVAKRARITNTFNSVGDSLMTSREAETPESPLQRGDPSPPINISPPILGGLPGGMPPLPPIPGLSMPLSMPSTIASLPPVTSSLPPGLSSHGPPPISHSTPFPHLFAPHYNHQHQQSHSDDASDTGASDRSEERPRGEIDPDDDQDNSLEKMSGLANMAALKGLAGFPGPSGLMSLASGAGLGPNSDHSAGRPRFDFYRVRATDPRPCHLCGKIYKNAHTLRTHMEDKHSNCNGFRCVLCGTVAKSRNSLHSHMSRQHRGISTKDLPLLPMPAPWNPEMASKYIQLVGGVGEVVRQNYRRPDRENSSSRDAAGRDTALGSDPSTPTSQENGALSPYLKSENDKDSRRTSYDAISRQLDLNAFGAKPPSASLLDTYLQMMRASGVDFMQGMQEKAWEEFRQSAAVGRVGVLDLTRHTGSPPTFDDEEATRGSDNYSDDEFRNDGKEEKTNGRDRPSVVSVTPRPPDPSDEVEDANKWAIK